MEMHVASFLSLAAVVFVMATLCRGLEQDEVRLGRSRRDSAMCEYDKEALNIVTNTLRVANETSALPGGAIDEIWNMFSNRLDKNCVSEIRSIKSGVTNVINFCQKGDFALMETAMDRLWSQIDKIRAQIYSEVSSLNFEEEIKSYKVRMQTMREKRQGQIEKGITLAVEKIVPHLLNATNLSMAEEEFNLLGEYQNDIVTQTVNKSIAAGVDLSLLVAFATRINSFPASFLAMELVVPEMEARNVTQEYGIFTIHCQLQKIMSHESFEVQTDIMKSKHHALAERISPYVDSVMDLLVKEIEAGNTTAPMQARADMAKANLREWYFDELVKHYMESDGADFKHIDAFAKATRNLTDECHLLFALRRELVAINRGEGFDALKVWLTAKYNSDYLNFKDSGRTAGLEKCKNLTTNEPRYKTEMIKKYSTNIDCKNKNFIKKLHERFGVLMNVLLSEFILNMKNSDLEYERFDSLMGRITSLPSATERCWAAEALRERLRRYESLNTFQHFRLLRFVKATIDRKDYELLNGFVKKKCENANADKGSVFNTLLYGGSNRCRLFSRDKNEPFYCAISRNKCYVWVLNQPHVDQLVDIHIDQDTDRISLQSVDDPAYYMIREGEYPRSWRSKQDWFRVHATDDGYLLLEVGVQG